MQTTGDHLTVGQSPPQPWGLSRATPHLPEAPLPWAGTRLDPDTQLTAFLDDCL
ncbi:putative ATP-grasp-modified RiPP [Nonomuraea purpurea]|uniref:ATP-grasp-modified RiPP n=1 Tax=Nonomuraea purpurea TaxID=1849276 RepID=A0ABV8FWI9_9ACTN